MNPSAAELARVAAEQDWPRLQVQKRGLPRRWCWDVVSPSGQLLDCGDNANHAEALAVGLAALQVASVAGSTS